MATSIDLSGIMDTIVAIVPLIVVIMVLKLIVGMLGTVTDDL